MENWYHQEYKKSLVKETEVQSKCDVPKPNFVMSYHNVNSIIYTYPSPRDSGPRLNIKTVLSTYGDFHVKDKTAVRTSYLYIGIAIPGKTVFLIETAPW